MRRLARDGEYSRWPSCSSGRRWRGRGITADTRCVTRTWYMNRRMQRRAKVVGQQQRGVARVDAVRHGIGEGFTNQDPANRIRFDDCSERGRRQSPPILWGARPETDFLGLPGTAGLGRVFRFDGREVGGGGAGRFALGSTYGTSYVGWLQRATGNFCLHTDSRRNKVDSRRNEVHRQALTFAPLTRRRPQHQPRQQETDIDVGDITRRDHGSQKLAARGCRQK